MKVKELISQLSILDQENEVRLICDHGQSLMKAYGIGYGYIENNDEYMPDEIHVDELEEYDSYVQIVVIEG